MCLKFKKKKIRGDDDDSHSFSFFICFSLCDTE